MSIFEAKYLSDSELLNRIDSIIEERDQNRFLLADPEVSSDPERMPRISREMHRLDRICIPAKKLKTQLEELSEIKKMLEEASSETDIEELNELYEEYEQHCRQTAREVYDLMAEDGYIPEEKEDEIDMQILKFIEFAGPEYAWRLGINLNLDEETARNRLKILQQKGYLERVQGTLLHNYHRQKDWSKHMNHTYYQLSRMAELYLRRLRREEETAEEE